MVHKMVYNTCPITSINVKKRWRSVYFSILFTKTMMSPSKVPKTQTCSGNLDSESLLPEVEIIQESTDDTQRFSWNISRAELNNLMGSKNMEMLNNKFHGVSGLAESLHTDLQQGIKDNNIERRKSAFGSNTGKNSSQKGLFCFLREALINDTTIIILILCAALSINENSRAKEGWDEGYKIFAALILVLVISVVTNFVQEKQFYRLVNMSNDIWIEVTRQGTIQKVPISNVVVGDVVNLYIGDKIPAYGLFIGEDSLQVDESNMKGGINRTEVNANTNPFLFSGSKVAGGNGQMLVISVGVNTSWGKTTSSSTSYTNEQTPVQSRIKEVTSSIAKIGIAVATLVPIIMLIRHFTGYSKKNGKWNCKEEFTDTMDKIRTFTHTLMASAEDIPLAVTLTLSYCRKKMIGDQVMVKKLAACETMGSVNVICISKTGILTMNEMKVTKFCIGYEDIEKVDDSSLDASLLELYHQGVGLNTSGSVYNSGTTPEYSGSSTEKAILKWAVTVLNIDMEKLRHDSTILHVETFNSEKKRSGVCVKKKEDNSVHVHWKGAAELVLAMCSNYYQQDGVIKPINHEEMTKLENKIQGMAASGLECIAFAHKQKHDGDDTTYKTLNEEGLTLLGIVGIKDPCRPGTKNAISACKSAGVEIKMLTGDNVFSAKFIATECGILALGEQDSKDVVIEGEEFRNYTDDERMKKIDSIRIMARSTPNDKLLMVDCLKKKGLVVVVTSHSTEGLALKEVDIGLSMGLHGTEIVKESSDIVILDGAFDSIVKALRWGRCVYYNIQKFVQFQLTVNIAALAINFIASAFATDAPLTVVQLLWVNIIMDTLGSLALATEQPDKDLMHNKRPVCRDAPIITNVMWRNILAQSMYQVTVLLAFHFRGRSFLKLNESVKNTLIFNTFVICQVFNLFNTRKLEERNVFKDLHKNRLFLGIIGVIVGIQVVMVEFLNNFADTEKLNGEQWGICIGIAALTWPIAWFGKLIPVLDTPFISFIKGWI